MSRRGRSPTQATVRELWARAAGRCEFRGCNKLLYVDDLTKKRSNLAVVSHIVASAPEGPRGDPERSPELAQDIRNLILTCREHGKVVDDNDKVDDYPEELLQEFKQEHETRIRLLTAAGVEGRTHVLIVRGDIHGRAPTITQEEAHRAILPMYPAREMADEVDLTQFKGRRADDALLQVMGDELGHQVQEILRRSTRTQPIGSLSVFALGPIPLLVKLGHTLGDLNRVHLHQRHRTSQGWEWPHQEEELQDFFRIHIPEDFEKRTAIALAIEVSGTVGDDKISAVLGDDFSAYRITAVKPSRDFLSSPTRLQSFGLATRQLLAEIRLRHSREEQIHVFAAVPAPVAIAFGRNIRANDCHFVVHDYNPSLREYDSKLALNRGKVERG